MTRDSVLGKHMEDKQLGQGRSIQVGMGRNEDGLFGKTIHNDQDVRKPSGSGELFDQIHGYGVPGAERNWKRLEQTIRPMARSLDPLTSCAGIDIILYKLAHFGPDKLAADQFQCFGLSEMPRKRMIMLQLEDAEAEIVGVRNIDAVIKPKDLIMGKGPAGSGGNGEVDGEVRVGGIGGADIG